MNSIHILVAEDDINIRVGLADTLESEGYSVTTAEDGQKALDSFEQNRFDLILLDIMMPGKSGYDVCRQIRTKDEDVPVIMLTAKGEEIDKVVGLQLGADDYITKPFGIHELLARISAVLRRANRNNSKNQIKEINEFKIASWTVNSKSYKMGNGTVSIDISGRELKILQLFYTHPDEVLSRDTMLNEIWGIDYFGTTRTLDQHIAQLRKKIETDPSSPEIITTIHGIGYRYKALFSE